MSMPSASPSLDDALIRNAPTIPGTRLGGNLKEYQEDLIETIARHAREHGDIFRVRLGYRKLFFLNRPEYAKHILQDNHRNYDKNTRGWRKLSILLRDGVFVSDGPTWLRQRRTMQPAFHRRYIESFYRIMLQETQELAIRWSTYADTGRPIDVAAEMMRLTFMIIAKTMFHSDVSKDIKTVRHALPVILKYGSDSYRAFFDLPLFMPTARHRRVKRALRDLDEVVYRLITRCRVNAKEQEQNDLLGLLLAAKDPDTGLGMSDNEIRDQVMTILLAGHETTANALSFTWHLLDQNPAARGQLEDEVDRVFAKDRMELDLSVTRELRYTRQVFQEALRLYPPVWVFARRAVREDQIDNYRIPANSTVFLCLYTLHRHPEFWDDPDRFDPMRFAPERRHNEHNFAYIPFSAGPRQCMGKDFAMLEATIILATLTRQFQLQAVPDHHLELDPALTLRPKNGLWMTVHSR